MLAIKHLLIGLGLSVVLVGSAYAAATLTPAAGIVGSITVRDIDGTPLVTGVQTIQVTNGSLTDNGGGNVTLSTGGAGALEVGVSAVTSGTAGSILTVTTGPVLQQVNLTGLVIGNGASQPTAYAGCSSSTQVIRVLGTNGACTFTTITSTYVDTSIWTGTATGGILKATSQGVLATATAGTDYAGVGTANTWADGVKQTFNPDDTNAGLNMGSNALEPTAPVNGDLFYNSTDTAVKFYENGLWRGLGVTTLTDTLDSVFDRGKIINGANSEANCVKIGDGVNDWCMFTDATQGPRIKILPEANAQTWIPTNKTWCLKDEEGAACVETIDPDAATQIGKYAYGAAYRPLKSVWFGAGSLDGDGTQCPALATSVTINSGPKIPTFICTDNDASSLYGSVKMPLNWDGGTLLTTHIYIQTAADTGVLNGDITFQCRGNGEVPSSTWGAEVALDDAAVVGTNANDFTTSAAATPAGTCAAGDMLYMRYQLDATGTTTAVTTLHHVGFAVQYSETSRSQ